MRILVSGFEAFGGEAINPTALMIGALAGQVKAPAGVEVRGVVLPVTFEDAFAKLSEEIRTFDPDAVISLGLAMGRSDSIELERVAINCIDAEIADNKGVRPRDAAIESGGPTALMSTLPLRAMLDELKAAGVPARISNSAGTYVCNFLMYRLLESNLRTRRMCGFVHVPCLPEQAAKTPGRPSMPLAQMADGLGRILAAVASRAAGTR